MFENKFKSKEKCTQIGLSIGITMNRLFDKGNTIIITFYGVPKNGSRSENHVFDRVKFTVEFEFVFVNRYDVLFQEIIEAAIEVFEK